MKSKTFEKRSKFQNLIFPRRLFFSYKNRTYSLMQVRLTKTLISIKINIRFGSVTFGKSIEVSTKKLPKSQKNLILPRT